MIQGHTVKLGYLRIFHRGMREENDDKFNLYYEMNEINEQTKKLNNNIIIYIITQTRYIIILTN